MARKWINSADVEITSDGAIMVKIVPMGLLGCTRVTVDTTPDGRSLESLLGAALPENLQRIKLIASAAGVWLAMGSAVASAPSCQVPTFGLPISCTKDQADALRFIAAADTIDMDIILEG